MIIKSTRVQTSSNSTALSNHLLYKDENERIELLEGFETDFNQFHAIAACDGSKYSFRHFSINPGQSWTLNQQLQLVDKIKQEYRVSDRPHILIRHTKNLANGSKNEHLHLVIPERFNGSTMDKAWSYIRNEKLAREFEIENGHPVQIGKHNKAISKLTSNQELKHTLLVNSRKPLPKASYSSSEQQQAKRRGIDLASEKLAIKTIYQQASSFEAFQAALNRNGYRLKHGKKAVIIEKLNGDFIGSASRLLNMKKKDFLNYIRKEIRNERGKSKRRAITKTIEPFANSSRDISDFERDKGGYSNNFGTDEPRRRFQNRPDNPDIGRISRQSGNPPRTLIQDIRAEILLSHGNRSSKLKSILLHAKHLTKLSKVNHRKTALIEAAMQNDDKVGVPITSEEALRQIRPAPKPF
ncbi:hypothetical protein ABIE64_001079 [Thalassospira sp. MBR-102]|uniref:hypothetical protein n=1 Tax=Thalassospira sp. MBR-102 TaxID=3156466 RepID=UPI003391DAE0